MDLSILMAVLAVIMGVIGILGSVLPVLPGPPISYAGMLLLYLWGGEHIKEDITGTVMVIMLIVTIAVVILDYIVPSYFTKVTGGSRSASRASMVGMLLGIFFLPPWGMIVGAFIGALLAEMIIEGKQIGASLKSAFGSFLGFLFGTGLKLVTCGIIMYYIIVAIIP
ncbi:MAG: DUF456 domain-containing protein [Bacteroidales bacterium]|nr:DUF456 domain-containing protein [Bacteroidales bacterium]